MKNARQTAILSIIERNDIETQEELALMLKERGIVVTQATVSRDIKELRLLKVLSPSGKYKYATSDNAEHGVSERLVRMFVDSVLTINSSGSLIIIRTLSGSAVCVGRKSLEQFQAIIQFLLQYAAWKRLPLLWTSCRICLNVKQLCWFSF